MPPSPTARRASSALSRLRNIRLPRTRNGIAAIAAAIVAVAVLSIIWSYHSKPGPLHIAGTSTDQIRSGPAHGDVLQLAARAGTPADSASDLPPPLPRRRPHLYYVLIQSYGDQKLADAAETFLRRNGIACSIEHGVNRARPEFYQVVGLQSFSSNNSRDFIDYCRKIQSLGKPFYVAARLPASAGFAPKDVEWED